MGIDEKLKRYEKLDFLGEGQFATVYKAKDLETGNIVAVKKIKVGTREEAADGINRTALREIKLLQELKHHHIIGLQDVFGHRSNVSLVFDFMDTDLEDLKPNNLLINDQGLLKLGDFGLAKFFGSPSRIYTNQVVTRWYRCPELLFGARQYGTGVDMWAVGCILAELLLRVPFLPGDSDLDQLSRIFQMLGTPSEETWASMKDLPDFVKFKVFPGYDLKDVFIAGTEDLLCIMKKLLAMDPLQRCSATESLKMDYFSNKPPPTPGHLLPKAGKPPEQKPNLKRKFTGQDSVGLVKRLQF
ncbi:cyclin-dependent kinase 7-like isoform X2 [Mytilus galloprovincialis]|uniref:cyclin-dependent kinase 7-like isoform X2 n=1 Tax=Mytilus galloprovincialis TaxID=29158 RepID=UPI003F7C3F61